MNFEIKKYTLSFNFPAATSRGPISDRSVWLIKVYDPENPDVYGLGECAPLKGLSVDDRSDFEEKLHHYGRLLTGEFKRLSSGEMLEWIAGRIPGDLPAARFGFETAFLDFINGGRRVIYENEFVSGVKTIPINGLVWMGEKLYMLKQVRQKLQEGFRCIKIKIGALDFQEECELLDFIRVQYPRDEVELRLDANGAFTADSALDKLKILAGFHVHSIEQPVKQGQSGLMKKLCETSPIPVSLDEELIGIDKSEDKKALLEVIKPQYITLKPSLTGGFRSTAEWIQIAESLGIKWWITSALESNIGLNAIAQFTAEFKNDIYQGLGTGQLYHNNFPSPIVIEKGHLKFDPNKKWKNDIV